MDAKPLITKTLITGIRKSVSRIALGTAFTVLTAKKNGLSCWMNT